MTDIISFNKKSQAQIISTILIILLVLAAIVIVWQVVRGTVKGGAEEIETQTDCIGLNIEITKIDTGLGTVTIRPSKDISSSKFYKNGRLNIDGGAVTAFSTSTLSINDGIVVGDVIEVLGKIGETICPTGAKETVK